jgi:hypothetical protein
MAVNYLQFAGNYRSECKTFSIKTFRHCGILIAFGREALVMTGIGMNNAFQRLSKNLIPQTLAFSSQNTL